MKLKPIFATSLIPLNTLLFFFLFFEDRLTIPSWLQVFGRMHPVALHFPIVLVIGYAGWIWLVETKHFEQKQSLPLSPNGKNWPENVAENLLLASAFTAAITAIVGLVLSREPGYEGSSIAWHKWMGAFISFGLWALYSFQGWLRKRTALSRSLAAGIILITLWAGHLGGNITHGENFVLGPVMQEKKKAAVPLEEAVVYTDLVSPILENKCMSCHNQNTAKGGLVLDNQAFLIKGGKDGKLWDTSQENMGLLMSRIHLPREEKKHMPPANKEQLTDEETAVIYAWIKGGADFTKKVIELPSTDTLRVLASGLLRSPEEEHYEFSAADDKKVKSLNSNYRAIHALAEGSPALAVDYYGVAFFKADQLKELDPLKNQIVSLNLDKMPVEDKDLRMIAGFPNLRILNLSFTKITGAGMPELAKLTKLKSLSLSGTAIKADDLTKLQPLKDLRRLYIWNTGILPEEIRTLRQSRKDLVITTGFNADTVHSKLNAPILENEERIVQTPIPLKLKHYVPGAVIRYTFDGTDPDSLSGAIYDSHVLLPGMAKMRAKAFKKGWLGSELTKADFYSEKFRPDSLHLLTPIDSDYLKFKPGILIDLDKGDMNFGNGKWLGFHKNKMEGLLFYKKPTVVQELTLSALVDIINDIMPPLNIEVWGGQDRNSLRLLGRLVPDQPTEMKGTYLDGFDIKFKPSTVRVIKLVVNPVPKLPDWMVRKGKKGWIMMDEIFVN
ncbi:c-type cytochrome domain-containing protein [Flavitalea flava]